MTAMTIAEKILSAKCGREVLAGEFCIASVDLAMVQEMLSYMVEPFEEVGILRVWDPGKILVFFDHYAPAPTTESAAMHRKMRAFARKYGIRNVYDIGAGICHQVLMEEGWARPGMLIVGTDSHTTTYGAVGAASTGIGLSEMISVFESGTLWFRVPETIRCIIEGALPYRISSKDAMLGLAGTYGTEVAQYRSIEFSGSGVSRMGISSRMTMCNMGVELGAKFALVAPDDHTISYLSAAGRDVGYSAIPDREAHCERTIDLDAGSLEPMVARTPSLANAKPASEVSSEIDQAFLGSCTNGRIEDMRQASEIIKGKRIAPGVRLIVTPASRKVYLQCLREGILETFVQAGGIVTNPTCGACWGGHMGLLAEGERAVSSSNRNFVGRMGHPKSEVFVASPATVAASALEGRITDPRVIA